jgi:hypothetical protein
MRLPLLIALTALSLGGCGKGNQAENMTNADQGLAAENIVSNDVTAIDAVTGDASNMAADVNYTAELNVENATGNAKTPVMPNPRKPAPGRPPLETPTPAGPVTNNAT